MSYKFPGVALVTGAGGTGIGSAVAKAFVDSNCNKIVISDLNEDSLAYTRKTLQAARPSAEILAVVGNIADEVFVKKLAEEAVKAFGRIDYAVNCAGVNAPSLRSHETSLELFDHINNVNYRGCWLSERAWISQMLTQDPLPEHVEQRGAIVNIASQLGLIARPNAAPYCASKAAVINMTRSDAIDYSKDNIRINCVCPGIIETPMTTRTEEIRQRVAESVPIAPMNRMGRPEEIAAAVLFLCSGQASFIQGHTLVVDGGYSIN
ncbi:uncharacterized protein PV09_03411 [Verruconis gallopava]|uniref:Uncharacterized protein n=1 Tax=Verruconis gallopava TaxID=253628 RepID=A0A0D1XS54_9PEZI|nr:uncharacterized protein PV09_03411 [Verruconis gallopava]KIW05531.1 hypothetical protein PV09_03411 [Verruconis gallopava]